jgi:hypothetical protein
MRRKLLAVATATVLVAALATTTGCTRVRLSDRPETRTFTTNKSVALAGATTLTTELRVGVGELTVSSLDSSANAMVGDFTYAPASWAPEVDYAVSGDTGRLVVRQPSQVETPFFSDVHNTWNVRLPKGVPTDLTLQLGVGTSKVDLTGLDLTALNVLTGVGDTTIDLSGPRTADLSGRIEAGVGKLTVRLPKTVGVRVNGREDGVGQFSADGFTAQGNYWVNAAYGGAGPKIEIDLIRGVGDVTLVLVD